MQAWPISACARDAKLSWTVATVLSLPLQVTRLEGDAFAPGVTQSRMLSCKVDIMKARQLVQEMQTCLGLWQQSCRCRCESPGSKVMLLPLVHFSQACCLTSSLQGPCTLCVTWSEAFASASSNTLVDAECCQQHISALTGSCLLPAWFLCLSKRHSCHLQTSLQHTRLQCALSKPAALSTIWLEPVEHKVYSIDTPAGDKVSVLYGLKEQGEAYPVTYLAFALEQVSNQSISQSINQSVQLTWHHQCALNSCLDLCDSKTEMMCPKMVHS